PPASYTLSLPRRSSDLSRARIFTCRPSSEIDELPCAEEILSTLARRAYRRPVTEEDLGLLLRFFESGRERGDFDAGIQNALRMIDRKSTRLNSSHVKIS